MVNRFLNLLIFFSLLLVSAKTAYSQQTKGKINTRILYVGYSPNEKFPANSFLIGASISDERFIEDLKTRMGSFEALLKQYFSVVETVDSRSYKEEMSDKFDVTVFDGLPKPLVPEIRETDPVTGKITKYSKPKYLSDGFSGAAVLIAQNASALGEPIGLFTDWYCMCLHSYALNVNTGHEIFNTPLKTKIKFEKQKTPSEALGYPNGKDLPLEMPMWRVQTESSKDGKGYRTGMVSHGLPFMESRDCEYISGGQSMKDIGAAAIARHGNFFFWGFAASPNFMTESAKLVFVNSVQYIKKYADRIPVMRKTEDILKSRMSVDFSIASFSKQNYLKEVESTEEFVKSRIELQKEAKLKQSKGVKLTSSEQTALNFTPYTSPTWEKYLEQKRNSKIAKEFNGDLEATVNFLKENRKYYTGGNIQLNAFDEIAKKLGIANNNPEILDAAIKLMESGSDPVAGLNLLKRYTVKEFETVREWRDWYEKHKPHLFFSETNGYKFYVDSYNNPQFKPEEIIGFEKFNAPEPDELNPVTSAGAILLAIDGNKALVTKVRIKEGYYIYATCDESSSFTNFSLEFELPEKVVKLGRAYQSDVKPYDGEPGITVYKDEIIVIQKFTGEISTLPKGTLKYQYCDKDMCSLPIERVLVFEKPVSKVFNLTVKYDKPVDDILRFSFRGGNGKEKSVKIEIKKGTGSYSDETCQPFWARVNSTNFRNNGSVFLDFGDITLTMGTENYDKFVEGSATNDEYKAYMKSFKKDLDTKSRKYTDLYVKTRQLQREGLAVSEDSINFYHSQFTYFGNLREKEYIRAFPDSYLSLALGRGMYNSSVEYPVIKEIYDLLSHRMQQTIIGRELLNKVKAAKETAVGNLAPDFLLTDSLGVSHKLSDYRGKYIFLDFWKWGCIPCIELIPSLKALREKYSQSDFEILGIYHVYSDDKNVELKRWKELLVKHSPSWINLIDLSNDACEKYGIEAFPSSLLIGPDGKVISFKIEPDGVDKYLKEHL